MSVLDDPTGLDAVADGLRAGHSLPARWYADPELLAREQELHLPAQLARTPAARTRSPSRAGS